MTKFCEFLENFLRNIPEKFSGIPQDFVFYAIPRKIRKIRDQVLSISQELPEKISEISWKKFRRNSQELLETKSQNYETQLISKIRD